MRANAAYVERTVDDRMFPDAESKRNVWSRLIPFYQELMESQDEKILLVSHGDVLSVFHALRLGWEVEMLDRAEPFGLASGVSFLYETPFGKHGI